MPPIARRPGGSFPASGDANAASTGARPGSVSAGSDELDLQDFVRAGAAGRGVVADADVVVRPFKLTDGTALASVVPGMAGWNVTGTLGATAHVSVRDGRVEPTAVATVDDVSARDEARSFVVEGLSGAVKIDSFSPFSTGVAQRLVASKLTTGKLALTDGLVEFRVERPNSILIEQTNWGWAGGRVYSHAFRIDPQKVDVDVVLYADGLRVSDLLALVAENRATGEGDLFAAPLPARLVYVMGAEGEGLDAGLAAACDTRLSIPGTGAVESLNVAAATAVFLAQWWQRTTR